MKELLADKVFCAEERAPSRGTSTTTVGTLALALASAQAALASAQAAAAQLAAATARAEQLLPAPLHAWAQKALLLADIGVFTSGLVAKFQEGERHNALLAEAALQREEEMRAAIDASVAEVDASRKATALLRVENRQLKQSLDDAADNAGNLMEIIATRDFEKFRLEADIALLESRVAHSETIREKHFKTLETCKYNSMNESFLSFQEVTSLDLLKRGQTPDPIQLQKDALAFVLKTKTLENNLHIKALDKIGLCRSDADAVSLSRGSGLSLPVRRSSNCDAPLQKRKKSRRDA